MKLKSIFMDVIMTFFITLAVSVVITLLWNWVIEKRGAVVDWKTSFPLAIIMGIVLPVSRRKK
jgi:hypothetical protein